MQRLFGGGFFLQHHCHALSGTQLPLIMRDLADTRGKSGSEPVASGLASARVVTRRARWGIEGDGQGHSRGQTLWPRQGQGRRQGRPLRAGRPHSFVFMASPRDCSRNGRWAVGCPPTAVGYPPTAVGYPPTAVAWPQASASARVRARGKLWRKGGGKGQSLCYCITEAVSGGAGAVGVGQ